MANWPSLETVETLFGSLEAAIRAATPTKEEAMFTNRPEELWDAWAFAAMEAELALDAWKKAAHGLKATAFAAYRSALDREEQAAAALASRLVPHVGARLRERWAMASSAAA